MTFSRRSFCRRLFAASAAVSVLPAAAASAATPAKLTIASSVKAVFSLPLYVATANGYFGEEGLDVETIFFTGGPGATAALLGGSCQVISSAFENGLKVAQQGQPIVNVMTMQADFSGALVVTKSFADKLGRTPTVADMKGARIGTLQRGGFADSALRYLLLDAGLNPDKDTNIIPIRGYDKHIAAAKAGEIDASLMVEPWQTIAVYEAGGWQMITNLTIGEGPKIFHDIGYVTLQTSADYLKSNRPIVEKVVRALIKAQGFISDRKNLDRSAAIAAGVFGEIRPDILRRSIESQLGTFRPAFKQDMIDKTEELLRRNNQISGDAPKYAVIADASFKPLWDTFAPAP